MNCTDLEPMRANGAFFLLRYISEKKKTTTKKEFITQSFISLILYLPGKCFEASIKG